MTTDERLDSGGKAGLGLLPILALTTSLGVLVVALADAGARTGQGYADPLFWAGLTLMILPAAARLFAKSPERRERLGLVVALGLGAYLVKVVHSPVQLTFHDELGHYRSTVDILRTGELFAHNPLVGTYGSYPGIEIVTVAVVKLTGLSIFHSALTVVGVARIILMGSLFLLFEQAANSPRAAGVASLLYAANPAFIYFQSAYSYESLAFPLALLVAMLAARDGALVHLRALAERHQALIAHEGVVADDAPGRRRDIGVLVAAALVVAAVVATHHVTAWALALYLISLLILAIAGEGRRLWIFAEPRSTRGILPVAVLCLGAIGAWSFVGGDDTIHSLRPVAENTVGAIADLITGQAGPKRPFQTSGLPSETTLGRAVGIVSILLILTVLPVGLWAMRRRGRLWPVQAIFVLATLAYPITLGFRLTTEGTETSNRASEFLFVAISLMLASALAIARRRRRIPAADGVRSLLATTAFGAFAVLLVIGGLIVGWPPYARLPSTYEPAAGSRSIDPYSVQAARWVGANLPRGSLIATDALNGTLMIAYGGVDPQRGKVNGELVARLFFTPRLDAKDRAIIQGDKIRTVVIDRRLSTARPLQGRYFEGGDPVGFKLRPGIPKQALAKFDGPPGVSRVFDSGPIQIYDTRALLKGELR